MSTNIIPKTGKLGTGAYAQPEPKRVRYVLVAVTGRDRADQRVHTEVFYTHKAALAAWNVLLPYTGIAAEIIEDSHG